MGHEESGWSKTHHAVQGCLYEHHVGVPPRDAVLSRVFLEQRIPFDDRAELRQVRFPSRIHWAVIIPSSSRQGPEEADEEEVDEQPLRVIGTLDQLELGECDECRRIAEKEQNEAETGQTFEGTSSLSPFLHQMQRKCAPG